MPPPLNLAVLRRYDASEQAELIERAPDEYATGDYGIFKVKTAQAQINPRSCARPFTIGVIAVTATATVMSFAISQGTTGLIYGLALGSPALAIQAAILTYLCAKRKLAAISPA